MIEPKVQIILPPKQEPSLRVGVVLAEDRKISLQVSGQLPLEVIDHSKRYPVAQGELLEVRLESNKVSVYRIPNNKLLCKADSITLHPFKVPTNSDTGITIDTITAGRGFHWQKEIRQTFPGELEFIATADGLVVVNVVNFETYLACVITSEMSSSCPLEFAKAQAVAARSWAQVFLGNKHPGMPYEICNDDDCQRYQGITHVLDRSFQAVRECRGEYLVRDDESVCPAYYMKSCGGYGENAENIFGPGTQGISAQFCGPHSDTSRKLDLTITSQFLEWLSNSKDAQRAYCSDSSISGDKLSQYLGVVDEKSSYFRWEYVLSKELLLKNLNVKAGISDVVDISELVLGARGTSGRILNGSVKYRDNAGNSKEYSLPNQYEFRRVLHESFLYSSAVSVATKTDKIGQLEEVHFRGAGWGHGVGLCQIGALAMALGGADYKTILAQYYAGCAVMKSY
ncbi:MAG: SpoIID/LytB domain-containing protein [Bdellovibrionales bacterium]|nr:SpoIID/LytB domain-containing protein [Bdellovibrionales bacterium]